jgi:hypothetical protein
MVEQQQMLFDERFLEKYAGSKLLNDPITAVIELIANSWDAGATEVKISWPDAKDEPFSISDNGCGLSAGEFEKIWSTLSYDRTKIHGNFASANGQLKMPQRLAFGRNGVGRCAGFCFGKEYILSSVKDGKEIKYRITSNKDGIPFHFTKISETKSGKHMGTIIVIDSALSHGKGVDEIRSEVGMRFFPDLNFNVFIQNRLVTPNDISDGHVETVMLPTGNNKIEINIIDTIATDRTVKYHGIAWKVNNRLVGEITWDGLSRKYNVDGRRTESRRYSFLIFADFLNDCVLPDWSGFEKNNQLVNETEKNVYQFIWNKLTELSKDQRNETFNKLKQDLNKEIVKLSPLGKEKWEQFIMTTQERCPSISEGELSTIGSILANLEISKNKYNLLNQLNELTPEQLDNLDNVLSDWSVDYAKIVLDELQSRLSLLKQLDIKLYSIKADEVHELQPLFEKGLWIFGPEFESIEYTSNVGMTKIIQELFGDKTKVGSRNRPDFVIRTDSSVGLYSRSAYDNEGTEIGFEKLVIIELKAPGVQLTATEINQPGKYAQELFSKGILKNNVSTVNCFVIGQTIEEGYDGEVTLRDRTIIIRPIVYDIVIRRAKSRLLNLYDKLKETPFIKDIGKSFTKEIEDTKASLF